MNSVVYDGSFEGFLCAVFDVYEYRLDPVSIVRRERAQASFFGEQREACFDRAHAVRVWKGLKKKLSPNAQEEVYRTFLSDLPGIEDVLLRYIRYTFSSPVAMEQDFSNDDVLLVHQTAHKVWKEKHRMEAFVRFRKAADGLFHAVIEPVHDVLPLIVPHFESRYADQRWMIYDALRHYGIFYDGEQVSAVSVEFSDLVRQGGSAEVDDETEDAYRRLWKQYFNSVNIPARKNTKLQLKHVPRRYWRYLLEMGS